MQKVIAKVIDGTRLMDYACVSSDDQNIDMQIDALEPAGCEIIYKDGGISGANTVPPWRGRSKTSSPMIHSCSGS